MALHYYYAKCNKEGCEHATYREFRNRKDYNTSRARYAKNGYLCSRHTDEDAVLSNENTKTSCELIVMKKGDYKYWQEASSAGTDDVISGFQYGNGYKAWARDFEEGTRLIVTAKIIKK